MLRSGLFALAGLALAACASATDTSSTSSRECFRPNDVSGYSIVDDNHVSLTVGAGRRYIAQTVLSARDLDWTHAIAIQSRSGIICTGRLADVDLVGGDPPRRFGVASVERAPDDQPAPTGS